MATTDRGYPLFAQTDSADIATKLNAISQTISDDIAAALQGPAWLPLSIVSGVSANGGSFPPQYRVWPDGKVELRGAVTRNGGATFSNQALLFDLPAAASPAHLVELPIVGTFGTTNTANARLEINTAGAGTLWCDDGHYLWVGFDSMFFYRT